MVEGARLEIVCAGNRIGGSNPLASARLLGVCVFCSIIRVMVGVPLEGGVLCQ